MKIDTHAKRLIVFAILGAASLTSTAQSTALELKPSGAAVIVSDIDNSVRWYQSVFGLKIKTTMNDPNTTYKVVILEAPTIMLELMQLKGAVARDEILKGKPDGSQIMGHFKISFTVNDIDVCLRHLKEIKIDVPRVWTDASTGKRNFLINDPDGNYIQFFD